MWSGAGMRRLFMTAFFPGDSTVTSKRGWSGA